MVGKDTIQKFGYHFQQTLIGQSAFVKGPDNPGMNSFDDQTMKISMSSTFYLGFRLWKHGSFYINPDIAGGSGLSGTHGVAGYMNGEIFRVGNPAPSFYFSRMYIRQYIPLSKNMNYVSPDANQLGELVPDKRFQITFGKFSLADLFDNNHYSHDPRTRFINWSLMNAGAYDFASNTKGYTYAVALEYISPYLSIRSAVAIEPTYSNGPLTTKTDINGFPLLDMEVAPFSKDQGYGYNFEIEKPFKLKTGKNLIIRTLGFINYNTAGKYTDAMKSPYYKDSSGVFINNASLSLASVRQPNALKYGFSLNIEYPVGKHAGIFSRISWNDGKTESFAFAEIDRSESIGIVLHGTAWNRYHDRIMMAFVSNQISDDHKDYLVGGGYGFMLGEPNMNYGYESIVEIQYVYDLGKEFLISPDFQYIINPGYDKNRGNISVFGIRTHISF